MELDARKRTAAESRDGKECPGDLLDQVGVCIFTKDTRYRYTYVNRVFCELLGRSVEEILGRGDEEFFPAAVATELRRGDRLVVERGETVAREERGLFSSDREPRTFWTVRLPLRDGGAAVTGLCGIATEITALRQGETDHRRLYRQTPAMLQATDREGRVVEVNDHWLRTMGYSRDEVIGRRITDFYTDASRHLAEQVVQPALVRDGSVKNIALHLVRGSGEVLEALLAATAERDAAGAVVRVVAVLEDVTEKKGAETARRVSEERFKAITMTASDAILLMDDRGKIVHWNPAAARIFGHSAAEALGRDLHLFLAPARLHGGYLKGFETFVRTGQGPVINRSVEMVALRKDGSEFAIEVSTSAMDIDGKWHALGIVRDITARKQAERALRESERSLATLIGNLPGMAYRCRNDRDWTMEFVSEGATALTGFQPAELIGNAKVAYNQIIHPDDWKPVWDAVQKALAAREKFTLNYRIRRADGRERWVWEQGQGVFSESGDLLALEGFITDVTDSRLLEEEQRKSQKLESIGTLAGGIAHDFNNLLQGVFGYLSMARITLDQKEKSLEMLLQAEKALHQSVNLTSQLLTFSKGGKPVKKVVGLRPLIENTVAFALSGSRVTAEIDVAGDLRAIEADEGQISQVIQNIVINADQAMPLGGVIRVAARNVPAAALIPPAGLQGDLVEITIRDQGAGIPAEHLARIFDPYFTTKERGSGLGLATAYSIVKNHGGLIRVRSEIDAGATFAIYLPASGAAEAVQESPTPAAAARPGRILVMDDEKMILSVARELLGADGHEAVCVESGEAALEAFRTARDAGRPFDLVVLDLTIRGGIGGIETLRRLAQLDPDVRAIVSSGYSDDAALANHRELGFRAFLKKPYTREDLRGVLHGLLA